MLKIELVDHDGYLHEGKPEIFIFSVNGKTFPCPAGVSIGEFWEKVKSSPIVLDPKNIVQPLQLSPATAYQPPSITAIRENVNELIATAPIAGKIEKGDFISCSESQKDIDGKAVNQIDPKAEYQVQRIMAKEGVAVGYEVINHASDWPQRMKVPAANVTLIRKTPKPVQVKSAPSIIKACECGEPIELKADGDVYAGTCQKQLETGICGKTTSEPRKKASAQTN